MSKACPTCKGKQVVKGEVEDKPCPALSVTVLGRLACKLPDGTFDNKAEHRSILNARMQKDKAYLERNKVVSAFARAVIALGGKAGKKRTAIPGWNPAWHGCVYVDLPHGGPQISWHYHEDHSAVFDWMDAYEGTWDGHDTPEKYRRLLSWVTGIEQPRQEEVEA